MIINEIVSNKLVIIPVISWFVAGILKVIFVLIKEKRLDFFRVFGTGGFPSSHSAYSVSLATAVGQIEGYTSTLFAISLAFALLVMADAAGVRRAVGKQAQVLNKLVYSSKTIKLDKELKELLGHTPFQVIAGALIGIIISVTLA